MTAATVANKMMRLNAPPPYLAAPDGLLLLRSIPRNSEGKTCEEVFRSHSGAGMLLDQAQLDLRLLPQRGGEADL